MIQSAKLTVLLFNIGASGVCLKKLYELSVVSNYVNDKLSIVNCITNRNQVNLKVFRDKRLTKLMTVNLILLQTAVMAVNIDLLHNSNIQVKEVEVMQITQPIELHPERSIIKHTWSTRRLGLQIAQISRCPWAAETHTLPEIQEYLALWSAQGKVLFETLSQIRILHKMPHFINADRLVLKHVSLKFDF